jgi:hypothetical protein
MLAVNEVRMGALLTHLYPTLSYRFAYVRSASTHLCSLTGCRGSFGIDEGWPVRHEDSNCTVCRRIYGARALVRKWWMLYTLRSVVSSVRRIRTSISTLHTSQ